MSSHRNYRWAAAVAIMLVAALAYAWLSGILFWAFSGGGNPIGKTDVTTWFIYWAEYAEDATLQRSLKRAAAVALLPFGLALCLLFILVTKNKDRLHGVARFATHREIRKSGLLGDSGIVVGRWRNRYLMYGGSEFVALAAATRSGKGTGFVIPNCLQYPDSMVIQDVKLENYQITSRYRQAAGHQVFFFNPFSETGETHRYNPLLYIGDDPDRRVSECLNIGYMIYPRTGDRNAFFEDTARNLFVGLVLYLCETPQLVRSIGEALRQASGKGRDPKTHIAELIKSREKTQPLSSPCTEALSRFLAAPDATLGSILQTFTAPLTVFSSTTFDAATSVNDFDFRELRRQRMTIYLGIPVNRIDQAALISNLFFSQLIEQNTDELPGTNPELKHQCLLMLDEFMLPGRIAALAKGSAYLAGYNLRICTIVQSPQQIAAAPPEGYGRETAKSYLANHPLKIVFTPDDQQDAEDYSAMLGTYTYKARSTNIRKRREGTESDQRRPLLLPQELRELPFDKQIVFLKGNKPILGDKISYFDDPAFVGRLKAVCPSLKAIDKRIPTRSEFDAAWAGGELQIAIKPIDVDLHVAKTMNCIRPLTVEDIANGVELSKLAMDTSHVEIPHKDQLTDIEAGEVAASIMDRLLNEPAEPGSEEAPLRDLTKNERQAESDTTKNTEPAFKAVCNTPGTSRSHTPTGRRLDLSLLDQ